jgi:Fic family protein
VGLILKSDKIRKAAENEDISDLLKIVERQTREIISLSRSRQFFYQNFREEFSYDSNAIEGNKITLPETYEILRKKVTITGKPLKDQMEIIGHAKAFDFLTETAVNSRLPLSPELILAVHKMIFEDGEPIAGRFRGFGENVVVGNPLTGKVFHKGINPEAIDDNIDGLIETYNIFANEKDINKIALLAGFHICFENIHPFCDGNGRTGRLIVNFEMIKSGYLPIDIKFAERAAYYAAFEKPDDYSRMTELFIRSLLSSIADYRRLHEKFISGKTDEPPVFQADTVPDGEF